MFKNFYFGKIFEKFMILIVLSLKKWKEQVMIVSIISNKLMERER